MIIECPQCNGTGIVLTGLPNPAYDYGHTTITCPTCQGRKTIEIKDNEFIDLVVGEDDRTP